MGAWHGHLVWVVVMKTSQFEAVKVALKQDKTGYVLTLCLHPDEIPEELLRDYVGARYQVVMVRLDGHEQPMDRQEEFAGDRAMKIAGALCRDERFWAYLHDDNQIIEPNDLEAVEWLREYLGVSSRAELKTNHEARIRLESINMEFTKWKQGN
jgi:hypothetical protein